MKITDANLATQKKIFQMQCEICKSLAHPVRLQIVDRLNQGQTSAADLLRILGISKGNLSKHVSLLVRSGVVVSSRRGRQIYYRLTDPEIHKACTIMRTILYNKQKLGEKLASAIRRTEVDP
jgi:DNA-binding transcriptional ArsR family regulator